MLLRNTIHAFVYKTINIMNNYIIREEKKEDFPEIYNLIKTAFETAQVKDGDEQDYAVKLRNSPKYIPELALVAEKNNNLIGHVMFTRFEILRPDESRIKTLLVAPLSVRLEYRNKGVGSALITEGIHIAKKLGHTSVFLCGNPDYYKRFGFKESSGYGITNVNNIPNQYSLAYELKTNALYGIIGTINFIN